MALKMLGTPADVEDERVAHQDVMIDLIMASLLFTVWAFRQL
ncbi:hypothetical protein [Paenibacillus glucanolyticus]|nr:hypothetical protein [Paenibacillus glucanolyticus]